MPQVGAQLADASMFYLCCFPQQKVVKKGGKAKTKKTTLKFTIDCSTPVEDEIMDSGAFVSIGPRFICLPFFCVFFFVEQLSTCYCSPGNNPCLG